MQTSTSIQDLKRTSKQDTDDLVNDILKELQTTPSLHSISSEPLLNSTSIEQNMVPVESKTEEKKNENIKDYLQHLKLPIGILLVYFVFHNNAFDSVMEQFAPNFMKYETSFANKLFKALFVALSITLLQWFS